VAQLVISTQKTQGRQFVEQMGPMGCRQKRSLFLDAKFILCSSHVQFVSVMSVLPYTLDWILGKSCGSFCHCQVTKFSPFGWWSGSRSSPWV
jgi:hypothetical protein